MRLEGANQPMHPTAARPRSGLRFPKLSVEPPVSVPPEYQRNGIGKALIQEGLSRLKHLGAKGCCLVKHPEYYRKFGFENVAGLVHEGVPNEVFFALSFDGRFPRGNVTFHEGFKAGGQQTQAVDPNAPRP